MLSPHTNRTSCSQARGYDQWLSVLTFTMQRESVFHVFHVQFG
jgi:hypothetical protein